MWSSSRSLRSSDLDRLLQELERGIARLRPVVARASAEAPRVAEMVGAALADIAERFQLRDRWRAGARTVRDEAGELSDGALRYGDDALRRLAREVEQRPLITLAIAVGVGALAVGLLTARRD